jgi:hypothetical protein
VVHAERLQHLLAHGLQPGVAAQAGDELAEQAVAEVGVVVAAAGPVAQLLGADPGQQVAGVDAGGAFPPGGGGFGGQPAGVRQQLGDRQVAALDAGQVLADGVGEVEQSFLAQAHDDDGDHALGDGPEAVLGLGRGGAAVGAVGSGGAAAPGLPGHLPVPYDGGDDRRDAGLALLDGQAAHQRACRHLSDLRHGTQA